MSAFTLKELIDLTVGSPEPGHVNFHALHCVLTAIADKINATNDPINISKYGKYSMISNIGKSTSKYNTKHMSSKRYIKREILDMPRMVAGADPVEKGEANLSEAKGTAEGEDAENAGATGTAETVGIAEVVQTAETVEVDKVAETAGTADTAETTATSASAAPINTAETAETAEVVGNIEEGTVVTEEVVEPVDSAQPPPPEPIVEQVPEIAETQPQNITETVQQVPPSGSVNLQGSIHELRVRLSNVEAATIACCPSEIVQGVSVMKDQLELAIENIQMLSKMVVQRKIDQPKKDHLRALSNKLRAIQKDNIYISSHLGYKKEENSSISWSIASVIEEVEEENITDDYPLRSVGSRKSQTYEQMAKMKEETDQYELDLHLCYPPEKILDQLLDLKSDFCTLTNKVNDIALAILEQDSQRTMAVIQDLCDQMRDVKFQTNYLKEVQERLEVKFSRDIDKFGNIDLVLNNLNNTKIDKAEVEILLADKVDYNQLQRKVSHEELQEMQCRNEKNLCELKRLINFNEKNMLNVIDNMRTTLGLDNLDSILKVFKEKIDNDIRALKTALEQYIEATNDDCAAAGARVKVLQDLACLSCDTTCVMRTVEKAKVGKLPSAHASNTLSPLITYELGNIRKSGIMGYYRKDDFPHGPHAWMNRQTTMKMCVPRHAGGPHTTHTAKERVDKIFLNKKQ